MHRTLIIIAAVMGALAVGVGAFGAHSLEPLLLANGRVDTFETASRYHFYHTLAILAAAWISTLTASRWAVWSGYLFLLGILFFSGSLYVLSIFNIRIMGAVAPVGGAILIIAWALLALAIWQPSQRRE